MKNYNIVCILHMLFTQCLYEKTTTEKDVKKLVEGYEKNTWGEVKVQKTPGTPGTTPSKSELEEPQDISNYRWLMGQLMW